MDEVNVFTGKQYKHKKVEVKVERDAVLILPGGISMPTVMTKEAFESLKIIFKQIEKEDDIARQVKEYVENIGEMNG